MSKNLNKLKQLLSETEIKQKENREIELDYLYPITEEQIEKNKSIDRNELYDEKYAIEIRIEMIQKRINKLEINEMRRVRRENTTYTFECAQCIKDCYRLNVGLCCDCRAEDKPTTRFCKLCK